MVRILVAAMLAALAITVAPSSASPVAASSCIHVYEIYYDSPGTDYGTNTSLNGEWIRLKNVCSSGASLYHWTIKDAAGHTYTCGSFTLGGYKYVKIHTGKGTNTTTDRYWGSTSYIWNNDTDKAYLRTAAGTLVYTCYYNSTAVDYKYC